MLVSCCVLLMLVVASDSTRPHIIFIVADDMGWNDVSFHGSDQIPTPNIDALAYNGVILNSHYVQPLCTPTRAALMTGRYPINLGMQGDPMLAAEPRGLPMMKILPEYLKELGYVTRAIGKWHLGFFQSIYTPTYRGFDSHLGYWAGSISYYDHIVEDRYSEDRILSGHDFRRNMTAAWDLEGKYATDVFTDEAVRIIDEHDDSKPLFLYLSHLAVHAGNVGKLLEAPQEEIDKFRHIPNPNRRTYAAMVSKMDESVGRVVEGLEKKGMLHNSIIVFISDNGAPTVGIFQNWGSNYPLRGMKASLWEGGVRGVGLVWSPLIRKPRRVSNGLMHVSDWLPTLYRAAGGNANYLDINLDGVDQWHSIVNNEDSPRTHVLLNINEKESTSALRIGKWKLTVGSYGEGGKYDKHFGDSGISRSYPKYNISSVTNSRAWRAISYNKITATWNEIDKLRHSATVTCNKHNETTCNPWGGGNICLFDMHSDPCEYKDMRWSHPDITEKMYNIVNEYGRTLVLQINQPWDLDGADPRRFNNTWSPWND